MYKIFIPIKQQSQRVPNKNFRLFKNKKLYQYVLEKFNKDKSIKLCIDTDSKEIQEYCFENKIDFIKRKKHLCGHKISVVDIIKNYIVEKNITGNFCQTHITTPFLRISTIKKAYNFLNTHDCVIGSSYFYNRFWKKDKKAYVPINHDPNELVQTQDLPPLIMENSCFYILNSKLFLLNNNRTCQNPYFYEVKLPESLDIDTNEDWNLISNVNIK
jgi:CMP-N-acetylneuraminic acid synthetase